MKIEPIDFVLSLVYYAGEIDGRTRLQKIAYFVSEKLNLDFGFIPYHYGPYSPLIAKTLEILINTDFIEEEVQPTSSERLLFIYKLKASDEKLFEEASKVREAKSIIERLTKEDLKKVIVASKVHFLLKKNSAISSLQEEARKNGWNISNEELNEALALLKELGFYPE